MTDTEKRLATALSNSPNRVYKTRQEFEEYVEEEKARVKSAADQLIGSGIQQQADTALTETRQSRSEARDAAQQAEVHLAAVTKKLEEATEMLNIATDMAWGGVYEASAEADHKTANRLRYAVFTLYGLALAVAVGFAWWTSRNPPDGWEWLLRSFIGGPVVILLWAAAYASRESREHRNSARLFKHQSLAFKSLDSYAKRIEETHQGQGTNEAAQFLKKTADSLFTNQIDAHVEQIKTQGRTGRFALRLLRERSDKP